jgi:hypothetical protein
MSLDWKSAQTIANELDNDVSCYFGDHTSFVFRSVKAKFNYS